MEDPRISQQQVAQPLSGTESLPVVQESVNTGNLRTLRTDINALKDYLVKDFVNSLYPAGAIMPYASNVVDASMGNWLLCDGRSVSLSAYPRLYNSIGTTYGSVDANSFNLPDLRGRVIVGYCDTLPKQTFDFGKWDRSNSVSVGSTGGKYNVKLQKSNMPFAYASFPTDKFAALMRGDETTSGYVQHDHPLYTWTCTPNLNQFYKEFLIPAVGSFKITATIRTNGATWTRHKMEYKVGNGSWRQLYGETTASSLNFDSGNLTGTGIVSVRACVYRASGQNDDARMWIDSMTYAPANNAARYAVVTRSYSVGETNGTVSDSVSISNAYEYYAVGGTTSSNCRSGSNSTTISLTLNGSSQTIGVQNNTYRFVLLAYRNSKTYYRILDTSDSSRLISSNSSVVDFSSTTFKSLFDLQKFKEVGSASCSVVSQSRKGGPCYGGMSGTTYVMQYKQQPSMGVITDGVNNTNSTISSTQPYMALNYIIKY